MAWTIPRTWTAGEMVDAAVMNAHVRDNFKALVPQHAFVTTSQTTASTTYTDLATVGPAVTIAITTACYVFVGAQISNNTSGSSSVMSYVVRNSGDTTDVIAASDDWSTNRRGEGVSEFYASGYLSRQGSVGTGTFIFRAKYKIVSASTGTFRYRWLMVFPVGLAV